ncbi:winged helix-turn-helix domain-containing protein [uncultured Tateyamaria sp.]|uniref:winged helix-turn-helix domain-containing protein n=1 Tax=uncultured Tateyamaria sp. TaxID=455651 RepID=UPI0026143FD4|nr:winged helix-turn-helix domain-containing protein [uncultured Tateyamaria sp.]
MSAYRFENYVFEDERCELFRAGDHIHLEPQVGKVLQLLLQRAGTIVSRDTLLTEVWGGRSVSPAVIDNRIRAVRRALRDDGRSQRLIKTFMNEGYQFVGALEIVDTQHTVPDGGVGKKADFPARRAIVAACTIALIGGTFATYRASDMPWGARDGTSADSPMVDIMASKNTVRHGKTIAVLPFVVARASGGTDQRERLAKSLIDVLSAVPDLKVVSSLSSFRFAETNMSPTEIAETLNSNYLVTGDLVENGENTALTIQMMDTDSGIIEWTNTYLIPTANDEDRGASAVLPAAALDLLNAIGMTSELPSERLISPEAHRAYVDATTLIQSQKDMDILDAIAKLKQVIALEPNFVPAYTMIISAYHQAALYAGLQTATVARQIDKFAFEVEPKSDNNPDVLTALGLQAQYHLNYDLALARFDEALRLDPLNAHAVLLRAEVLRATGRSVEADAAYEQALSFDPLSPVILSRVARSKFGKGELKQAFTHARDNLRWNENDVDALTDLAMFLRETGEYAQSFFLLQDALQLNPGNTAAQFQMLLLLSSVGKIEQFDGLITSPALRVLGFTIAGDEAAAREMQDQDPLGQFRGFMHYVFGDSTPLYEFLSTTGIYSRFTRPGADISAIHVFDAVFFADVNLKHADEAASTIIGNVRRYFDGRPVDSLRLQEDFMALAGLYALEDNTDAAIETISVALDKGFVFIGTLERSPVFETLRDNPDFHALGAEMRQTAHTYWAPVDAQAIQTTTDRLD